MRVYGHKWKFHLKFCLLIILVLASVVTLLRDSAEISHMQNIELEHWEQDEWFEIKDQFKRLYAGNPNDEAALNKTFKFFCPQIPANIRKRIKIFKYPSNFNATDSDEFHSLGKGSYYRMSTGRWMPTLCRSRHRVAIIIPYKNRLDNLNHFLNHMHPFLQRQELEYQIFVVEQANDQLFNKGILMNAGFLEIMSLDSLKLTDLSAFTFQFDCVIFHDVDLLPEGEF